LALAAIVSVQKAGGIAMFLDFENSLHHGYARSVGVDFDTEKLLYYSPETLEEGWKMLYIAIKQGVDIVVLDSLAAMVPAKELEKGIGDPAAIGAQARFLSNYLPKMVQWQKTSPTFVMFLNQPRATISTSSHGNSGDTNTAGGKAVKFYASGRLMLTRIRSDYLEKINPLTLKKGKVPYGNVTVVKVVKNKMSATQGYSAMVFIRYGSGVDEYLGIIETAIPRGFVKQKGSSYTLNGETYIGKDRLRAHLIENHKEFESLKEKISLALLEEAPKGIEIAEDDEIKSGNLEDDDEAFESGEDTTEGIEDIESSVEDSIGA
jgi:recombination protein RecA